MRLGGLVAVLPALPEWLDIQLLQQLRVRVPLRIPCAIVHTCAIPVPPLILVRTVLSIFLVTAFVCAVRAVVVIVLPVRLAVLVRVLVVLLVLCTLITGAHWVAVVGVVEGVLVVPARVVPVAAVREWRHRLVVTVG